MLLLFRSLGERAIGALNELGRPNEFLVVKEKDRLTIF
jgi:hypothetical protein